MEKTRIPLFPLELVLFPHMSLPLHIFEPRYRLMIKDCQESGSEFGIALSAQNGIAAIGCTAKMTDVAHIYPDDRMDILIQGHSRFRTIEILQDKPYLEAQIELLADETSTPTAENEQRLLAVYDRCHQIIYGRPGPIVSRPASDSLAFQVAAQLPVAIVTRQMILELNSEAERQIALFEALSEWLPKLADQNRMETKARGNGHAVN
jgi:Lon protease-like protein